MQVHNLLLFPVHYKNSVVPFSVAVVGIITGLLISIIIDLFYRSSARTTQSNTWIILMFDIIRRPFLVLLVCYSIYAACDLVQLYFPNTFNLKERFNISYYLSIVVFLVFIWIILRAITYGKKRLLHSKAGNN